MKIVAENQMEILAEGGEMTLMYRLFHEQRGYGIGIENPAAGETVTIPDITVSLDRALRLYDRLLRGQVTTVALRDVVEDDLAC